MTTPVPPGRSWSDFAGAPRPVDAAGRRDLDSTTTLPAVRLPDLPARPLPHALIGRFTVSLAGLLAAGCLVLGVALLVLALVAPSGSGLQATTGPGWPRVVWHLAVGALAELGTQLVRRRAWPLRVAVAGAVIVAVLAVLAFAWWA